MRKIFIISSMLLLFMWVGGAPLVGAAEPNKVDYTSYPVFMANTITPNILIIMDNSGSMDEPAYREEFQGISADTCGVTTANPSASEDDAEEDLDTGSMTTNASELYLGEGADYECEWQCVGGWYYWYGWRCRDWEQVCTVSNTWRTQVGVRFRNVEVPQDAEITKAYITFRAINDSEDEDATFKITGEASDDAWYYTTANANISNRTPTDASAEWSITDRWYAGGTYQTSDLTAIVQEIVKRDGWVGGESEMGFMITGTGFRAARSWDYGDHSFGPILHIEYNQDCTAIDAGRQYYGLFDPASKYSYNSGSGYFYRDPSGSWDGNWLNWLSMRKVDLAKKVMMGGQAIDARDGDGTQVLTGEGTNDHYWSWKFESTNVSPYNGTFYFGIQGGYIYVDNSDSTPSSGGYDDRYRIRVLKEETHEPGAFVDGNAAGVLQRIGDKARWGYASFESSHGSHIRYPVGADTDDIVAYLQNESMSSYTPLAESLYVALQYFKQEAVAGGLGISTNASGTLNDTWDPYNADGEIVWCAKSFVIMLTDGASTQDLGIPSSLKDLTDGKDTFVTAATSFAMSGSDYLKDVAHYMRTNDLRTGIEGDQYASLYTVYMFDDDPDARDLLKEAARQGGFDDRNENGWPDGLKTSVPADRKEWDDNEDGDPDTYYEAHDGYVLEAQLISAINDILARAASGTAASVLATNAEGEGNLVQAYFRPSKIAGTSEVKWLGYLQSLWVDPCGNLREDTNQNKRLDMKEDANNNGQLDYGEDINNNGELEETDDLIVSYYSDPLTSDTVIHRYTKHWIYDHPLDCEMIDATDSDFTFETLALEDIQPIWEVGKVLSERDPATRRIFTYVDPDLGRDVDDGDPADVDPFDSDGDLVSFDAASAAAIKPYLGVMDNTAWSYLGAAHDTRVSNLITYIRGTDFDGLRPRTINGNVWKLGDIVHSTPVTVARPVDNYHIIYGDESYQEYYDENRDREAVVYVGANDGMLHAFTSYYYDPEKGEYVKPTGREVIGEELWAYVPQTLLPHLKWLPDLLYEHSYYVDFKPKIFDAKIGENADGEIIWRTILICGLNYGGKHIWAEGDFNDGKGVTRREFSPTYIAMDITDPVNPILLWERSYDNLGMTAATPSVIRVKSNEDDQDGRWYVAFGSGPTKYDGTSDQGGYIFVVKLEDGEPAYLNPAGDWLYETNAADSFLNSPSSLDYHLTNNVDSIYFGDSAGNAWHISTHYPQLPDTDAVPNDAPENWTLHHLYEGARPITAGLGLSVDDANNVWVYFGTGRYISNADRFTEDQEYLIGIRDPYYSELAIPADPLSIPGGDLFNSSVFTIYETMFVEGGVSGGAEDVEDWYTLLDYARNNDDDSRDYHGWYMPLELDKPSERIITKPAVLGGALFVPAFTPNSDICGYGGNSNFYAVYYETGTPFFKELLPHSASSGSYTDADGNSVTAQKFSAKVHLGGGMPPPAVGIHTGRQEGATAYLQMSTGEVVEVDIDTPMNIKSALMNWRY